MLNNLLTILRDILAKGLKYLAKHPAILIALLLLLAFLAFRAYLRNPGPPTVVGAGGAITFPVPVGGPIMPGAAFTMTVTPAPPSPLSKAGTAITVTITGAGGATRIANVPVRIEILPGGDNGQTSMLDFGPSGAGAGSIVGTNTTAYTDAIGTIAFTVRSTFQGDEDILRIVGAPGAPNSSSQEFKYATSPN